MKKLLTIFILSITIVVCVAQKKPQIQETSFRAPSNVKIDGNIQEWQPFQAYNSIDRIYYTISNDDDNLYLAVHSFGSRVNLKILNGGITFTISHVLVKKGRANDPNNVSITFPVIDHRMVAGVILPTQAINSFANDTTKHSKQIDSLVTSANKKLAVAAKEIKIIGVKEIPDSTLSIYNLLGIKIGASFNRLLLYVYELAIPLKYLNIHINANESFSYNILLTGETSTIKQNAISSNEVVEIGEPNADQLYLMAPTDFWGAYTLAKKP